MLFYYVIYTACPVIFIASMFTPFKKKKPVTPPYPKEVDWLLAMD